jgi:hypothetical protein
LYHRNRQKKIMKKIVFVILSSVLFFIGFGCRHTIDFSQYPEVKYSTDVSPIITANCTQDGCHGSNRSKRFKLLTYDDVINHCKVISGQPEKSNLYSVVRSLNKNNRMPVDPLPQLTDNQIKTIYLWIGEGAKNN